MAPKSNVLGRAAPELELTSIGVDIGKDVFHIVGLDLDGKVL